MPGPQSGPHYEQVGDGASLNLLFMLTSVQPVVTTAEPDQDNLLLALWTEGGSRPSFRFLPSVRLWLRGCPDDAQP